MYSAVDRQVSRISHQFIIIMIFHHVFTKEKKGLQDIHGPKIY